MDPLHSPDGKKHEPPINSERAGVLDLLDCFWKWWAVIVV